MKRIAGAWILLAGMAAGASAQMPAPAKGLTTGSAAGLFGLAPLRVEPAVKKALDGVSAEQVKADIAKLVSFGTRSTLSSMDTELPQGQGILPAADWITSEFEAISKECGGCLEVKRDEFVQPASHDARSRVTQADEADERVCDSAWDRGREGAVGAGDGAL